MSPGSAPDCALAGATSTPVGQVECAHSAVDESTVASQRAKNTPGAASSGRSQRFGSPPLPAGEPGPTRGRQAVQLSELDAS